MFRTTFFALLLTLSPLAPALAAGDHHHEGKHGGLMGDTSGHHPTSSSSGKLSQ